MLDESLTPHDASNSPPLASRRATCRGSNSSRATVLKPTSRSSVTPGDVNPKLETPPIFYRNVIDYRATPNHTIEVPPPPAWDCRSYGHRERRRRVCSASLKNPPGSTTALQGEPVVDKGSRETHIPLALIASVVCPLLSSPSISRGIGKHSSTDNSLHSLCFALQPTDACQDNALATERINCPTPSPRQWTTSEVARRLPMLWPTCVDGCLADADTCAYRTAFAEKPGCLCTACILLSAGPEPNSYSPGGPGRKPPAVA